jgi:hypothetical protein
MLILKMHTNIKCSNFTVYIIYSQLTTSTGTGDYNHMLIYYIPIFVPTNNFSMRLAITNYSSPSCASSAAFDTSKYTAGRIKCSTAGTIRTTVWLQFALLVLVLGINLH